LPPCRRMLKSTEIILKRLSDIRRRGGGVEIRSLVDGSTPLMSAFDCGKLTARCQTSALGPSGQETWGTPGTAVISRLGGF
jgi:hypothetical protein